MSHRPPAPPIPNGSLFPEAKRVENARGRTHEGSGIGLALVQELVRLHGGSIIAESEEERGTTFTATLPLGSAHLPLDQIAEVRPAPMPGYGASPYVEEALRWLPDEVPSESVSRPELPMYQEPLPTQYMRPVPVGGDDRPRVLVADDNADMRDYVARLLTEHYRIQVVPDGEAALATALERPPDLVLTDVMMPRLDGFGLLRGLRADPRTQNVPVIMLSARAGEESRVEGMEAGADDYLIKPFGARELLARVGGLLQIARLRQESEQAIRQSEERFRLLFETMTEGFAIDEIIFDDAGRGCDLRYLELNSAFERHTGLKRADILGRTTLEMFPDAEAIWFERFGEVAKTGVPAHFQSKFGPLERWFEVSAYRTGPGQVATVFFDITDRKRAEENERESRSRLDSTLAASEIGTWEYDVVHNKVRADHNLSRMFGVVPEEADGGVLESYLKAIHPEDRERVSKTIGRVVEAGETYEADYRLAVAGNPVRWVIARGRVERDGEGRPLRMPGVVMDITGQRQAEAELRKSEERRRLALDSAELGAWHVDPTTMTLTTDDRFRAIFGVKEQRFDYEQAVAVIHPDDQAHVRDAVAQATRPDDPTPYAVEYRVVHPDGSIRWVFAKGRANFERTESGRTVVSFDGTVSDVTARKQAEQERERLVGQLREQDQRKDEFLATLAHELRNPLAPIRNGLQIMKLAGGNPDAVEKSRSMMERQVGQMTHLIDDLMDLARISGGKIVLQKARLKVSAVVQDAVDTSRPLIEERGHDLVVDVPPEPLYVDADRTRLAQVFGNLLNNAAKYTEAGGRIRVAVERQGSDVVVAVEDNGVGIPAHMLTRVFDMFAQVDRSLEKSQGGLGIGLNIVKRLTEMHDGSIVAESGGHGAGSRFFVRLPVALAVTTDSPDDHNEVPQAKPARRRILVVDDNRDGATSLAQMLGIMGNDTQTAFDGLEAVAVAEAFRPDVILMDIGMPKLNGYEACRRIREQPWGRNVVIVAQTGWGQEEDRQKSHDAGFDCHMVKPVDPLALEKLLEDCRADTA